MRIALICLCLVAVIGSLTALDLPVTLSWESHNEVGYLPSQTGKEYNWREYYRIGLGVDSLQAGNLFASFLLQSRADFISNQVELRDFELGYNLPLITISAASELIGYGKANRLNPLSRVSATQDDYRYQATRFNRLGANLKGLQICAGGNQHNQSILKLSYSGKLENTGLVYRFSQEARIQDSHWSSPASISASELGFNAQPMALMAEAAYTRFFAYDNTPAHDSFYAILETLLKPCSGFALNVCGEYRETEPKGLISKFVDTSLTAGAGKLKFSPGFRLDTVDGDSFSSAYLGVDWLFLPGQRIGILYRCENLQTPNHVLGLQAGFGYRL